MVLATESRAFSWKVFPVPPLAFKKTKNDSPFMMAGITVPATIFCEWVSMERHWRALFVVILLSFHYRSRQIAPTLVTVNCCTSSLFCAVRQWRPMSPRAMLVGSSVSSTSSRIMTIIWSYVAAGTICLMSSHQYFVWLLSSCLGLDVTEKRRMVTNNGLILEKSLERSESCKTVFHF